MANKHMEKILSFNWIVGNAHSNTGKYFSPLDGQHFKYLWFLEFRRKHVIFVELNMKSDAATFKQPIQGQYSNFKYPSFLSNESNYKYLAYKPQLHVYK